MENEKKKEENIILYPASKGYIPKSLFKKEREKIFTQHLQTTQQSE